jgi:hypothetical protein
MSDWGYVINTDNDNSEIRDGVFVSLSRMNMLSRWSYADMYYAMSAFQKYADRFMIGSSPSGRFQAALEIKGEHRTCVGNSYLEVIRLLSKMALPFLQDHYAFAGEKGEPGLSKDVRDALGYFHDITIVKFAQLDAGTMMEVADSLITHCDNYESGTLRYDTPPESKVFVAGRFAGVEFMVKGDSFPEAVYGAVEAIVGYHKDAGTLD